MQKNSHRLLRVENQIMREIAELLKAEIEDPRIKKTVNLTRVKMSPDLRHAKIFFTLILLFSENADENIKAATSALNHSTRYLRRRIAENLPLRLVPNLFFIYDESLEKAQNLIHLIDHLSPS